MSKRFGLYGEPPRDLVAVPPTAMQFSPLMPGADRLEDVPAETLDGMVVLAPAGTIERNYVLALALRSLKPGAPLSVLAANNKGGARLTSELARFGVDAKTTSRRHHRLVTATRPADLVALDTAIADGAPQIAMPLGLWTQPGIFSWDRRDTGTELLLAHLPRFAGHGADFGCGIGLIAAKVLSRPSVAGLTLIDIDRRAIDAARRNISDARAQFHWADARQMRFPDKLDFVVSNPPFHFDGHENRGLGQTMLAAAASALRKGGAFWLVANRHLPYEAELERAFATWTERASASGFKVIEAIL